MASTADSILDAAEELIMTRGYNAFSYADIASQLSITTASMHYHFPKKETLGVKVVQRYTERMQAGLRALDADSSRSEKEKIEDYFGVFIDVSSTGFKICLCGALGGEFVAIPEQVQKTVCYFFDVHESWLSKLLADGKKSGSFAFTGSPAGLAKLVFASLEGALIVARSRQDPRSFYDCVATIRGIL